MTIINPSKNVIKVGKIATEVGKSAIEVGKSAIEVGRGAIQSIWWIFEYLPCIIAHFIRSLLNDDLTFFIGST